MDMMSLSNKFHILYSYAFWNESVMQLKMFQDKRVNLFLDSGAFTNFTQNKEVVKLDDYIHFCQQNKSWLWNYIALDVIGDEEQSNHNFEVMKNAGLKPIPVFTRSSLDPKTRAKELLKLCEKNEFIAIGGVAGRLNRTADKEYLYQTCHFVRKYTKTKVHILGCGAVSIAKDLRPFSMDSSASTQWNAYGAVCLWDNIQKKMQIIRLATIEKQLNQYDLLLKKYRLNKSLVRDESFWASDNHHFRSHINLYSFYLMNRFLLKNNVRYFQALPTAYIPRFDEMVNKYGL